MRYPKREVEIVRLAQDLSRGLAANPDTFPAPPASANAIDQAIADYHTARETTVAAVAGALAGTAAKNAALETLSWLVRFDLRYAEAVARGDGGTLQLVGWAGRRKPVRNELEAPGQVITLEVRQEGESWVTLAWQEPFDGGSVSAYRVQRRRRDGGDWTDVGTSVETTVTLEGQDTGVELEYQVMGVNAAGAGPASNVVRVVL